MDDREALEFCRDPAHLEPAGPALRRKGPRKTAMAAVRFDPAVIDAARRLAEGSEMTVSSWIRKLVAAEIAEPVDSHRPSLTERRTFAFRAPDVRCG